ncbi:MAG: type IV pilus twitching motility protein PilT [Terriglobia bacterium]
MTINEILQAACGQSGSDVHLKVNNVPAVRVNGEIKLLSQFPRLTLGDIRTIADGMMGNLQKAKFHERGELDFAYAAGDLGRFRANVYQERGMTAMVLRIIPATVRTLGELHLPPVVAKFCEDRRGMLLVTGAAGMGKSTALAAMIERINSTRAAHIITIEDPIEFYHSDKKGFVNQREVGSDTPSFEDALRSALRQDPDVLMVGEMRDLDTMRTALNAAETGHLVLSSLHTLEAQETVQRVIGVFPSAQQTQARMQLASTLNGVVSLRLVRRADGRGRVPAVEVLVATDFIRECIINPDKTRLIREILASGASQYGMQTFDQSLYDLYLRGLITLEEASIWASNAQELKMRAAGVRSTSEGVSEELERATASNLERFGAR